MADIVSTEIQLEGIQIKLDGTTGSADSGCKILKITSGGALAMVDSAGTTTEINDHAHSADDITSGVFDLGMIDLENGTAETTADDADLIPIFDDSAEANRMMTRANLPAGVGGNEPDYDSGWFAVASPGSGINTYTKAHSIGSIPRHVEVWHSSDSAGDSEWYEIDRLAAAGSSTPLSQVTADATNVYVCMPFAASYLTVNTHRGYRSGGYARVLAWE